MYEAQEYSGVKFVPKPM